MKIQTVTIYNKYNLLDKPHIITANQQPGLTLGENLPIKNISNENYIAYLPNFCSKKHRDCSSNNTALQEKSGDFLFSQFNGLPCPACGKKMLSSEKFNEFNKELSSVTPDKYLEVLMKYKIYMRPVEESVFNEIWELSQKTPKSTKDIRSLLVNLRNKKLPILQRVQLQQVNKMIALSKTLPADERLKLEAKIKNLKQHIRRTNSEAPFRRKIMIDSISKFKIRNPKQYQKLQNIAQNFPTSSDTNSAWIVKYSGKNKKNKDWTSFEIAQRFLASSIPNTDHILAYSIENNHDDISNYLAMHSSCNSQKGDKTFLEWIYEDKDNRLKFLQCYFKEVTGLIKNNQIQDPKYLNYPIYAKKTIYETTKGVIDLR